MINDASKDKIAEIFLLDASVELTVLGAVILLVIQYLIVIIWVASPAGGNVRLRNVLEKPFSVFSATFLLLGLDALLVGLSGMAHSQLPDTSSDVILALVLFYVPLAAFIVGMYFAWVLSKAETALPDELKNVRQFGASSDFEFQRRRQERLSKRKR